MNKINNRLFLLTLFLAGMLAVSHFDLIKTNSELADQIDQKNLEIVVYKTELKKMQEKYNYVMDENQNMTGYTNFLESQNAMLVHEEEE